MGSASLLNSLYKVFMLITIFSGSWYSAYGPNGISLAVGDRAVARHDIPGVEAQNKVDGLAEICHRPGPWPGRP